MGKIANDTLSLWGEEGSHLISQNFEMFRSLVAQASDYVQHGKYDAAAVYSEMAALYATGEHCGFFVSLELEHILLTIGQRAIGSNFHPYKRTSSARTPRHILHVATSVMSIGGHSRMLWRWIEQDTESSHSVVLTRQAPNEVPKALIEAVKNTHGKIYILNEKIGSVIYWAKLLREIATTADLVVLHIHNYDVIPIIAFANKEQCPPIIFLNHSDHLFWLGASISDVVVNLRESSIRLSQERRGIEPERNVLLPIILTPTYRKLSRTEAKQMLGLPENALLILSIGRSIKYKTINCISFADVHVPLLQKYEQAFLIVIGPGNREDWLDAIQKTQGRIIVHPEHEDTALFLQAADIYVDSFPFVSNTSLLEAGSYGVPLITRYPYSSRNSAILGADMPGLTGNLICARDIEEYTVGLSRLIEDEEFRFSLGEKTKIKIAQTHWGNNWHDFLNDVYIRATSVHGIILTSVQADKMFNGEPDVFLPYIHAWGIDIDWLIQFNLKIMPFNQRLQHWFRLGKKNGSRLGFSFLLPEWLYSRYLSLNLGLRKYLKRIYENCFCFY